jgi:hypothetical protein
VSNSRAGRKERELEFRKLKAMMAAAGVTQLYFKVLAPNDNSKNQPYLGSDLSALNIFPTRELVASDSTSDKTSLKPGRKKFTALLNFSWMDAEGCIAPAPGAQLILYPQYPEVRFSGFLRQCEKAPYELMDPTKRGRDNGRILFMGVTKVRTIIGYLASPESVVAKSVAGLKHVERHGLFGKIELHATASKTDSRIVLLNELCRIHRLGWIKGRRLQAGQPPVDCNNPNCGGYTLEAELGVLPTGAAEPDFMGWEVKQYGVSSFDSAGSRPITLMTPEPDGGFYSDSGVEAFIRKFGYADKVGRTDRYNFGGVHKYGERHSTTGLTLTLLGYDAEKNKITDPSAGLALVSDKGQKAAVWHYSKLIDHWKRKHAQAVYVPALSKVTAVREYHYGKIVRLGVGTDFFRFLGAIAAQRIYYDPGIKLENASSKKPRTKRRSQFRVKSGQLDALYDAMDTIDVMQAAQGD